jgi:hypothetical protein
MVHLASNAAVDELAAIFGEPWPPDELCSSYHRRDANMPTMEGLEERLSSLERNDDFLSTEQ